RATPIRVGVLDFVRSPPVGSFLDSVQRQVRAFHMDCTFSEIRAPPSPRRISIEEAVDAFQTSGNDILLVLLSDEPADDGGEDSDEWGAYRLLKSLTVGRGIPSQVVYGTTLGKQFAISNVVLGLLGKTGNIPYVLADPLAAIDLVVGLDVARERKSRLP